MTIPSEMRYQVPTAVRDMQDGLSHLNCYKVCELHTEGNVAAAQHRWNEAAAKIQAGIDWLVTAPETQVARVADLESTVKGLQARIDTELAKAKADAKKATDQVARLKEQVDTYKARASNFERLNRDLQNANLDRPEVATIVSKVLILLTGLRYVTYVADRQDLNRQMVCGMMLKCQQILQECGAEAEVAVSDDDRLTIMTDYYATLRPQEIEGLKNWASYHEQLPERQAVA